MREYISVANKAKLSFVMSLPRDNFQIKWSGFNDSLLNFVGETWSKIFAFKDADFREIFD